MRFGKNIGRLAIPQWKQCYLDYEHLKVFVKLIKQIVQCILACEKLLKPQKDVQLIEEPTFIQSEQSEKARQCLKELEKIGNDINSLFFDAHTKSMSINRLFLHMKLLEMGSAFKKCKRYFDMNLSKQQIGLLMEILEFVYVETSYLETAKEMNLEGERKILKKHVKCSQEKFECPRRRNKKILRISKQLAKLLDEMQNLYIKHPEGSSKKNRDRLRHLSKKLQTSTFQSFVFGSWIGIGLSILGVLVAILVYTNKSIETDYIFNRDFATWRGVAVFIFYIWILGLNVYGFEKYSISHRIIFEFNQHHYSTSTEIFMLCGFLSTFFIVMFAIYTLNIAQIIQLTTIPPYYLALFVWVFLAVFLFNPTPILFFKSRLYSLKLIFKCIIAPFIGVSFSIIWMTDQFVSLITPLRDFAYTICYYKNITQNKDMISQNCGSSTRIQVVFVVGAIAYTLRILQCLRQGYDKKKYLFEHEFYNTIKYLFSLITLTLSFFWRAGNDTVFSSWIVFAIISTLYSYIWDIKIDWALLQPNSPYRFLRKYLCYPIGSYYVIVVINLILRLAWVFTLSPSIANEAFGSPQIFSLVVGMAQIIRRGIWNMLRVEREHLSNIRNFKAVPSTIMSIQNLIIEKFEERKQDQSTQNNMSSQIIQIQNEHVNIHEVQTHLRVVKSNHLDILYEILEKQTQEKIQRCEKVNKIKKRLKIIIQQIDKIGNKKKINLSSKIYPSN